MEPGPDKENVSVRADIILGGDDMDVEPAGVPIEIQERGYTATIWYRPWRTGPIQCGPMVAASVAAEWVE